MSTLCPCLSLPICVSGCPLCGSGLNFPKCMPSSPRLSFPICRERRHSPCDLDFLIPALAVGFGCSGANKGCSGGEQGSGRVPCHAALQPPFPQALLQEQRLSLNPTFWLCAHKQDGARQVSYPISRWRHSSFCPHAAGGGLLPACKMAATRGEACFSPPDSPRTHAHDGFFCKAPRRTAARSLAHAPSRAHMVSQLPPTSQAVSAFGQDGWFLCPIGADPPS